MGIPSEFKEFAPKGNVVDLAIGFIQGATFSRIVSSLMNDVIMPPVRMLLRGVNFLTFILPLKDKVIHPWLQQKQLMHL